MDDFFDFGPDQGSEYSFGLDWGTFRSNMACLCRDGKADVYVPRYSGDCKDGVPSLFSRDENGTEHVGKDVVAYGDLINNPLSVCTSLKTRLSESQIILSGHPYTPREMAVQIVRQVVKESSKIFRDQCIDDEINSVVVGVPVSFSAAEKGEIKTIVSEALNGGEVQLLPEPVLAALAINHKMGISGRDTQHPYLVCDFGAGTYDTTVLLPNPHPSEENPAPYIASRSKGSDKAGDLLDRKMAELILKKLRFDETQNLNLEVLEQEDHSDHRRLFTVTAREAKEHLSEYETASVLISGTSCGSGTVIVEREEYEKCIRDMIREDVALAKDVVEEAGLWEDQTLEIALVGGSSCIPLVQEEVQRTFDWLDGSRIRRRFGQEAVARGAAVFGAMPPLVRPTVPHGYGVEVFRNKKGKMMLDICIPSNADLPKTVKRTYYSKDEGQTQIQVSIYEVDEGEDGTYLELTDGVQKYSISHSFSRPVPKSTPVELSMTLRPGGELELEVSDCGISQPTHKMVTISGECC